MRAFARRGQRYVGTFEPGEAVMLTELCSQVVALLQQRDETDAAVQRLLPAAYRDDDEAAAEFRRFTADGLVEKKAANARAVIESVADAAAASSAFKVSLDAQEAGAWIRALTDIRLSVAARLGIETEETVLPAGEPLTDIYNWLGFVQESLVSTLR